MTKERCLEWVEYTKINEASYLSEEGQMRELQEAQSISLVKMVKG